MTSGEQANDSQKTRSKQRPADPTSVHAAPFAQPQTTSAAGVRTARLAPGLLAAHDILHLQRSLGNRAVSRLLAERETPARHAKSARPTDNKTNTGASNPVIQRVIEINGKSYGAEDKDALLLEQKDHIAGIKRALYKAEFDMEDRTIEAALADKRKLVVTMGYDEYDEEKENLIYEINTTDVLVKQIGNITKTVGGRIPAYIARPDDGEAQLEVSGLISCIGILIDVLDESMEQPTGAVGGHFVTPDMLNGITGELTAEGKEFVVAITGLADAHEGAKGFSFYVARDHDGKTVMALKLLNEIFAKKGYLGSPEGIPANGQITYSLFAEREPNLKRD